MVSLINLGLPIINQGFSSYCVFDLPYTVFVCFIKVTSKALDVHIHVTIQYNKTRIFCTDIESKMSTLVHLPRPQTRHLIVLYLKKKSHNFIC